MKLSRDSFLFKYAYLGTSAYNIPRYTTLCALFWRCVFRTCLYCLPFMLIGAYILSWVKQPWVTFCGTGAGILAVIIIFIADRLGTALARRRNARYYASLENSYKPKEPGLVATTFWAVKNRVCPRIHIED